MAKHNRYAAHNHNSKGFEVRLDFAEKDFIESDQWPPRCSMTTWVSRHSLQTQSTRHFQIRTKHNQFSTEAERTIIANHFEVRLISLAVTVIVECQKSYRLIQLPGTFFFKNRTRNDSRQIEYERFKNSVNPGWVEPDLNYDFIIGC